MKWNAFPFVRLACSFIAGICAAKYVPLISLSAFWLLAAVFCVYAILSLTFKTKRFNLYNPVLGFVALFFMFFAGYNSFFLRHPSNSPNHLLYLKQPIVCYEAIMVSEVQEKAGSVKSEAQVLQVFDGHKWEKASGTIILFQSKRYSYKKFRYGDRIIVKGNPLLVKEPANPGDFSFKLYLNSKNIFHQHFTSAENIIVVKNDPPNFIVSVSLQARSYFHGILKRYIRNKDALSVAGALILGITNDLDHDIRHSYIAAGAMHILAVSGLHVGVIHGFILLLLGKLRKKKYGRFVYAGASLFLLWAYAFVTGLSPSVQRAVLMFSFIIVADVSYRNKNIYNTIAASAFIILLINPLMLFSIGFQLSYLALIGIVYLQKKIYNLWVINNKIGNYAWQITSVSIAAQIAVFPLSVFYFDLFPTYSLLSNLFAIIGAFVMLLLGIVLLIVGEVDILGTIVGYVLEKVILLVNFLVRVIEHLPYSLIQDIEISAIQALLLYVALIYFLALLKTRQFIYNIFSALLILLFSFLHLINAYNRTHEKKLIVYSRKDKTAIDFIVGPDKYSYIQHSGTETNKDEKEKILQANFSTSDYPPHLIASKLINNMMLFTLENKSVIVINEPFEGFPNGKKVHIDYIVISNNAILNLTEITSRFLFKKIIIDNSNSYALMKSLKIQANKESVEIFLTNESGAFVGNLSINAHNSKEI